MTNYLASPGTGLNSRASYRKFNKPQSIFTSPDINDNSFQIVTSFDIIASVDNMKRIQCIE